MRYADFRTLVLTGASGLAGTRVFPQIVPQEVWDSPTRKPCVVYSTQSVERQELFCGADSLVTHRVNVEAFARDPDTCQALATAIRGSIHNFRGLIGVTTFKAIFVDSETDLDEPEPGMFRRSTTYVVWSRV